MSKDKEIMVVDRITLFSKKYFNGFLSASDFDFESVILKNFKWLIREIAEENTEFKQPIGYMTIWKPSKKEVFLYRRNKKHNEGRLQGKWSCGVGGHIEKSDAIKGNPITESSVREIEEEIKITGKKEVRALGYINDDTDAVGKVHFGILYLIIIDDEATVVPCDPEIEDGILTPITAIEEQCNLGENVENWTKITITALKNTGF